MTTTRTTTSMTVGTQPSERFWYVQEVGGENRYLRIHAHHMTVDEQTTALRFHNEDESVFMEFGPGEWSYMEHGEAPFS